MALAILGLAGQWSALSAQEDKVGELLARLQEKKWIDPGALYAIEAQPPDKRILPALEAAFEHREVKNEKRAIAATLLRLGSKSQRAFDYLEGFARDAVEDRTPSMFRTDASGRPVQGEFSAEFLNWCALHGEDPKVVAAIQISDHLEDLHALAGVNDPRARELFRKGLESQQPIVVGTSVLGLARLQDSAAIPLIAKACERLPAAKVLVAMYLPWYSAVEAQRLLEQIEPDPRIREFNSKDVQRSRSGETQMILKRTGGAAAKQ